MLFIVFSNDIVYFCIVICDVSSWFLNFIIWLLSLSLSLFFLASLAYMFVTFVDFFNEPFLFCWFSLLFFYSLFVSLLAFIISSLLPSLGFIYSEEGMIQICYPLSLTSFFEFWTSFYLAFLMGSTESRLYTISVLNCASDPSIDR